jgi:hypothetical protein
MNHHYLIYKSVPDIPCEIHCTEEDMEKLDEEVEKMFDFVSKRDRIVLEKYYELKRNIG